jgi:hypothetical protein
MLRNRRNQVLRRIRDRLGQTVRAVVPASRKDETTGRFNVPVMMGFVRRELRKGLRRGRAQAPINRNDASIRGVRSRQRPVFEKDPVLRVEMGSSALLSTSRNDARKGRCYVHETIRHARLAWAPMPTSQVGNSRKVGPNLENQGQKPGRGRHAQAERKNGVVENGFAAPV